MYAEKVLKQGHLCLHLRLHRERFGERMPREEDLVMVRICE